MSATSFFRLGSPISHSQMTNTRQPCSASCFLTLASRAVLASNFFCQNAARVLGVVVKRHPCLCQKQPCTKTTAWCLGNTRSGLPGSLACSRKRSPAQCRNLRTSSSGVVFFPRMPDIIRLRVALSTTSMVQAARSDFCFASSGSIKSRMRGFMMRATSRIMGITTLLPNCL